MVICRSSLAREPRPHPGGPARDASLDVLENGPAQARGPGAPPRPGHRPRDRAAHRGRTACDARTLRCARIGKRVHLHAVIAATRPQPHRAAASHCRTWVRGSWLTAAVNKPAFQGWSGLSLTAAVRQTPLSRAEARDADRRPPRAASTIAPTCRSRRPWTPFRRSRHSTRSGRRSLLGARTQGRPMPAPRRPKAQRLLAHSSC